MSDTPRFRVCKKTNPPKVWLQCSSCEKDIKEIKPTESLQVTRNYYCIDCEPNPDVITLNSSTKTKRKP